MNFYEWCINNNHIDYLELWDYDLNNKKPDEVQYQSNLRYYFKCRNHKNHPSELKILYNVVNQNKTINCKRCNSFGQFLEDNNLFRYWDYNKNNIDPYAIPKQWNKKIWMMCENTNYHESYEVSCSHYSANSTRCPYCCGLKVNYYDSLGCAFPYSLNIWSDKNEKTPYEYMPNSNKKVWWKCINNKHDDFYKQINVMSRDGFHCPSCSKENKNSYLQDKVFNFISSLGYTVLTEHDCNIIPRSLINNKPLPYDNEVVELKLIIEVNGKQHYWSDCSWYKHLAIRNNITPIEEFNRRKEYDKYKRNYAITHGYFYLEIPYWLEKDDKYKEEILNMINVIKNIEDRNLRIL